jgi:D-aminopeptidase
MPLRRARDLGWIVGRLQPGPHNAITDVTGVAVGHTTLVAGDGLLRPGTGPVRTGVTVIRPHPGDLFRQKVRAAVFTINGFGKAAGFEQLRELGVLESPVALTGTLNVGLVADALVQHALERDEAIGVTTATINVVVGETHDGYLNDSRGRHVRREHVYAALEQAHNGPVAEGNVGAGTGSVCFGWKGGIGTASRLLPAAQGGYTLGALVQANFGRWRDLAILGLPVGAYLSPRLPPPHELVSGGSIMVVLATDAPLDSRQLERLARRAAAGIARLGGTYAHSSGDFVLAFSTAVRLPHDPVDLVANLPVVVDEQRVLDGLFPAVADCVEEAVLNALCAAQTMVGRDQHTVYALPVEAVCALLHRSRHLDGA